MKVIAFYLPQFHTFPENDKWWGKGFTEWTNTRKAIPLFDGHYQPHLPYNNYYYDLTNIDVMKKQISIAKKYGVYGFCFYHYWFQNGKRLMEKPIEMFLDNASLDLKFCLSWANEHWTRTWDGGDKEIIMEQNYGDIYEWTNHYKYLKQFFLDKRYIYIDGKPVLIIYRPEIIDDLSQIIECWRNLARNDGFKDLYILAQGSRFCRYISDKNHINCIDGYIMYEPGYTYESLARNNGMLSLFKNIINNKRLFLHYYPKKVLLQIYRKLNITPNKPINVCDYEILCDAIIKNKNYRDFYPGYFTGWDNTARRGVMARIVKNSSPKIFEEYLVKLIKKNQNCKFKKDYLFLTAWNEWAEGAHLEPDQKYGYAYLESLKNALNVTGEFPKYD